MTGRLNHCLWSGWITVAGLAAFGSAGCTSYNPDGAPPSVAKHAIDHPAGTRIFFGDDDTRHVVSLFEDGTYIFKSGNNFDGVTDTREGLWTWKRGGSHNAALRLDANEWELNFVDPDSAVAVNRAASGQAHVFQFERME